MTEILLWVVAFMCFALPLFVVGLGIYIFNEPEASLEPALEPVPGEPAHSKAS